MRRHGDVERQALPRMQGDGVRLHHGMMIGPDYDSRATIRTWAGMSKGFAARKAMVTEATLTSWEKGHESWINGRFSSDAELQKAIERLADLYAGLLWIAGDGHWPLRLDDDPIRAAIARLRTSELPYSRAVAQTSPSKAP